MIKMKLIQFLIILLKGALINIIKKKPEEYRNLADLPIKFFNDRNVSLNYFVDELYTALGEILKSNVKIRNNTGNVIAKIENFPEGMVLNIDKLDSSFDVLISKGEFPRISCGMTIVDSKDKQSYANNPLLKNIITLSTHIEFPQIQDSKVKELQISHALAETLGMKFEYVTNQLISQQKRVVVEEFIVNYPRFREIICSNLIEREWFLIGYAIFESLLYKKNMANLIKMLLESISKSNPLNPFGNFLFIQESKLNRDKAYNLFSMIDQLKDNKNNIEDFTKGLLADTSLYNVMHTFNTIRILPLP